MEWIFNQLRERPEFAIFLTIFLGFWLGKLRIGKFTLGTVTSVLLVGVLVGQLNIAVPGPIKSVFFLLFLFAVGYKVGPQFFRGLKKDGLPQVGFAVLMCVSVLLVTWLLALMMGYNAGEAAGLLAGSQTISAVIGVAEDTMANMGLDEAQRQSYVNIIPVSYAVTYIFGTAGSAWVLSSIGPKMLGGAGKGDRRLQGAGGRQAAPHADGRLQPCQQQQAAREAAGRGARGGCPGVGRLALRVRRDGGKPHPRRGAEVHARQG